MVIGAAIKIGTIIIKVAKATRRMSAGGTAIVQRFPPTTRPYIKDIIKGANIVTAGGYIADIIHDEWNAISPPGIPTSKIPNKLKKKYPSNNRYNISSRNGYNQYSGRRGDNARSRGHKRCSCWRCC